MIQGARQRPFLLMCIVSCFFVYSRTFPQAVSKEDAAKGQLIVNVSDRDSGQPVVARCYLTDVAGESWFPEGAIKYDKKFSSRFPRERHFIVDKGFEIDLPTGQYTLAVERGMEHEATTRNIKVRSNERTEVKIQVGRWINMNTRRWYSGDLHNHRDLREMPLLLLAEDLNLAPTITEWFCQDKVRSAPPVVESQAVRRVDATHVYSIYDAEIERPIPGPGSIDLIGLKSPINFRGYMLSPSNSLLAEQVHSQGGYVDAEKILYRDTPALIALGGVDFAGVAHNLFNRHGVIVETEPHGMIPLGKPEYGTPEGIALLTMDVYYSFLNCGFRLPVSAGSASGVLPSPLGFSRVYVHLPGTFDYDAWFRGLKAGRNFATNGPMLFFTVNGYYPGDVIQLPKVLADSQPLKVHAEVRSIGELDRLEIVWKGHVIKSVRATTAVTQLLADCELNAKETGWIVARAFGKTGKTVSFAHSSPVYVQKDRDRGIVFKDVEFLIAWIDREVKFYQSLVGFRSETDRDKLLAMFQQARAVYTGLIAAGDSAR